MKEYNANVGDEVVVISTIKVGAVTVQKGSKGIIKRKTQSGTSAAVEFPFVLRYCDEYGSTHRSTQTCHDSCKPGYGAYIPWSNLNLSPKQEKYRPSKGDFVKCINAYHPELNWGRVMAGWIGRIDEVWDDDRILVTWRYPNSLKRRLIQLKNVIRIDDPDAKEKVEQQREYVREQLVQRIALSNHSLTGKSNIMLLLLRRKR